MTSSTTSSKELKHIVTNESITVIFNNEPRVVKKGAPNFLALKKAIEAGNWDEVPNHLTVSQSIESWSSDKFKINGNTVTYEGKTIPEDINDRIVAMATNGENPQALFNFWERLNKNPSHRSVHQLFAFMKHGNIPLTPEGKILTYKAVRQDFKDVHSGTFDNKPGNVLKMPRNEISDDPNHACHEGFHVGAMGYVSDFHKGGRIMVCEVDPEHVVSVPYDSSAQKMRVCEYKVLGHHGIDLPSTSISEDDDIQYTREKPVDDGDKDDEEIEDPSDSLDDDESEDDDDEDDDSPGITVPDDEDDEDGDEDDDPLDDKHVEKAALKADKKKEKASVKKAPPKKFSKFTKMNMIDLTKQSLDDLRKYATYGLDIVGSSKIPGGKVALISKIMKIRDNK